MGLEFIVTIKYTIVIVWGSTEPDKPCGALAGPDVAEMRGVVCVSDGIFGGNGSLARRFLGLMNAGKDRRREGVRAVFLGLLLALVLSLVGCGSSPAADDGRGASGGQPEAAQARSPEPTTPPPEVSVGYDPDSWVGRLGGELYARTLAENGFDATLEEGVIGRDVVLGYSESPSGEAGVQDGRVMLEPADGVEDHYVMSTSPEVAEVEGLGDVTDLFEIDDVDIAASEYIPEPLEDGPLVEFYSRHPQTNENAFDYLPGNLSSGDNPVPSYSFLKSGPGPDADVVLGWAVDGEIAAQDLVVLEDSQGILPQEVYHPAPLVEEEALAENPEIEDVLGRLSGALATEDVREMAARVEVEEEDQEQAVADYYEEHLAAEVSR